MIPTKNFREIIETLFNEDNAERAHVPWVSVGECVQQLKLANTLLVDIRTEKEWAVSRIANAISRKEFEAQIVSFQERIIICYCTVGGRAGRYTENLRARGFNAFNLKGSVLLWAHAGLDFVDESGAATKRVHVSGSKWNLLPAGYEAVW